MPQRVAWRAVVRPVALLVGFASLLAACAKDPVRVDRNRPPRTYLVSAPAESGSFSYRIHLYWRGEDPDGFVAGFQWAVDDSSVAGFHFTTRTDSIFEFAVNDSMTIIGSGENTIPGTSRAHTFYIRAVDNLGKPDPNLIEFNRRVINSTTERPIVAFKPPYPTTVPDVIDTLCDGQPFTVCWTGSDPDGYVIGYKFFAGAYVSPIVQDSCVTFNDPNDPNSVGLTSGLYTFTVQALDNALALSNPGASQFFFVVNRDPQVWFTDGSGGRGVPVGYYIAPFHLGEPVPPVIQQFAPGDTVPFRSTVWWNWDGQDAACDNPSGIKEFSLAGSLYHNDNDPYIIGFLPEIAPGIPFKTNDPAVLSANGLGNLILDSLDAGNFMAIRVRARDVSNRISGPQYSGEFEFHCNFPPRLVSFDVRDSCHLGQWNKYFSWSAIDEEDGFPPGALIQIENGLQTIEITGGVNHQFIPFRTFRDFSPTNPHVAELRVRDRAGYRSTNSIRISFDIGPTDPCP